MRGSAKTIGVFHNDIYGMKYSGIVAKRGLAAEQIGAKFDWCFVGHFHGANKVLRNVISIGSPTMQNFGEEGQKKGWWLLDTDKNTVQFLENTKSPQFITLDIDENMRVPDLNGGRADVDYFRIRVAGNKIPDWVNTIKWKRVSLISSKAAKVRAQLVAGDSREQVVKKYIEARNEGLDAERLYKVGMEFLK
jgi:DNA repair exonuclease SbcCD nuclease subunit